MSNQAVLPPPRSLTSANPEAIQLSSLRQAAIGGGYNFKAFAQDCRANAASQPRSQAMDEVEAFMRWKIGLNQDPSDRHGWKGKARAPEHFSLGKHCTSYTNQGSFINGG